MIERDLWKVVEEYQSTENRFERETLKWKYELENERYKECLAKCSGIGDLKLLSNNIETFKCKYEENLQLQLQQNGSPPAAIRNAEVNISPNFIPLRTINNGSPLPANPNNNSVLGKRKRDDIHKDESTKRLKGSPNKRKRIGLCDLMVGTIIRDSNKNRSIKKVDRGNNKQNWVKLKKDGTEPKRKTYVKSLSEWYGSPLPRDYSRKYITVRYPGTTEEIPWFKLPEGTQNVSNDNDSKNGTEAPMNCDVCDGIHNQNENCPFGSD